MCKLKFYWLKIWVTTNDKNRKESSRIEIISKSESWKNCLKFKQSTFLLLEADSSLSANLSDFTRNKITVDVGCVHMLIYNARVWRRLRALWCYNELGLTNQCFFKRGYFIKEIVVIWSHQLVCRCVFQLPFLLTERKNKSLTDSWCCAGRHFGSVSTIVSAYVLAGMLVGSESPCLPKLCCAF